jgi:hypothetical protein
MLVCVAFFAIELIAAVRRDSNAPSHRQGCEVLDTHPASFLYEGQERSIDLDTARLSEFLDFGDMVWGVREIPDGYPHAGIVHGTAKRNDGGLVVRVSGLPDLHFGMVFADCA